MTVKSKTKRTTGIPLLVACLLLSVLLRCGDEEMTPPPNPGGGVEEPLTDEQRLAALDASRDKLEELSNARTPEQQMQLIAWLTQRPEFQSAGLLEGGGVYAVFTDGRIVVFTETSKTVTGDGGRKRSEDVDGARIQEPTGTKELPKSNKVSLFNGMGGYFEDNTQSIEKIFRASKSTFTVERKEGSVENLKQVKDVGIFYFYTHGSSGTIPVLEKDTLKILYVPSFWTTTPVSAANEKTYRQYLDEKKLSYMVSTYDAENPVLHYGVTDEFIKAHWNFSENALIYLDACESFFLNSPKAQAFRDLIMDKATNNKATYIGWSQITNQFHATRASQFVFDRLLGTNTTGNGSTTIPKEDPVQRPFDLDRIFSDLRKRGFHYWDENGATLTYVTRVDDDVLITPTIERLEIVEYSSTLQIFGSFGSEKGEVTINGIPIALGAEDWSPTTIVCTIPETGDASAGNVVVSVRGLKSNPVPLTVWDIKLNYAFDDNGVRLEGVMNLTLRADIHKSRTAPGEEPSLAEYVDYGPSSGYTFGNQSNATYHIGGKKFARCNYQPCINYFEEIPHVQSGTVKHLDHNSGPNPSVLTAIYNWSTDRKTIRIDHLQVSLPNVTTTTYITRYDCPAGDEEMKSDVVTTMGFSLPSNDVPDVVRLQIADNYNIRAGSVSKTITESWHPCVQGARQTLVTWELVRPRFAPDDTTPARASTVAGE